MRLTLLLLFVVLNRYTSYIINSVKINFPENNNNKNSGKKTGFKLFNYIEKPLYTLIWYDCLKCKELVFEMEKLNIKYIFINGNIYFNDIIRKMDEFQEPLLYKEEILIGENLFDIYEEIYKTSDYY